jgi:hypothetical protein
MKKAAQFMEAQKKPARAARASGRAREEEEALEETMKSEMPRRRARGGRMKRWVLQGLQGLQG